MADENPDQKSNTVAPAGEPEPGNTAQKRRRRIVLIAVVILIILGAVFFWWRSTFYEDTDDAQINGHIIQISARVPGHVIAVNVQENSFVAKGTVIAELDPSDYQAAVEQDEANVASAEAAYEAAKVNVPVTGVNTGSTLHSAGAGLASAETSVLRAEKQLQAAQAAVDVAKANAVRSALDLKRFTPLVKEDVISKLKYDATVDAAAADKAQLAQAEANLQGAKDGVRIAHTRVAQAQASLHSAETGPQQVAMQKARADQAGALVQQAQAKLDQAKLNLSYTKIVAPETGIVNQKTVEVGQNVSAGQNMLTLVSLDRIWVTANFKETQLDHMRQGQPVTIHVDAYPGRKYDGRVAQIGGATGSELSLFPPENATGNYVKVVQRVPVRIDFTNPKQIANHLLRPGMSCEPKVWVKK